MLDIHKHGTGKQQQTQNAVQYQVREVKLTEKRLYLLSWSESNLAKYEQGGGHDDAHDVHGQDLRPAQKSLVEIGAYGTNAQEQAERLKNRHGEVRTDGT